MKGLGKRNAGNQGNVRRDIVKQDMELLGVDHH